MNSEKRWVHRDTIDGDVYYDRHSRVIYRILPRALVNENQEFWSLPTFEVRAPLKAYFDFTYLCNLECRHCVTNSSPRANRKKELQTGRIISIMDDLASIGVLEIGVGGGEPLCHPDLFTLLSHTIELGINVVVTTNGVLVTSDVAKRLKDTGVFEVRVSFDGSEPVHNSIRGAGRYRQALQAVRELVKNGMRTTPRITLCNDDIQGLDKLFGDLASAGINSVKMSPIEPHGRAALSENQDLFRYPRDTTTAAYLIELAQKNGIKLKLPVDLATSPELVDGGELRGELKEGKRRSCGAGLETVYISPEGNVRPCSARFDYIFGEVESNTFMTAWTTPAAESWRNQVCSSCTWFPGT